MSAGYSLPSLPYDYQSLEPFVDKETMFIHHTGHHQTYINKLNEALKVGINLFLCHLINIRILKMKM